MRVRARLLFFATARSESSRAIHAAVRRLGKDQGRSQVDRRRATSEPKAIQEQQQKRRARAPAPHYLTPFPGETTLPKSVARLRRSNMRQVSSDTLLMDSSPSRSLRRKDVMTQITEGRPSTKTMPESLRTASSSPALLAITRPAGKSRGIKESLFVLSILKKSAVDSLFRTLP